MLRWHTWWREREVIVEMFIILLGLDADAGLLLWRCNLREKVV